MENRFRKIVFDPGWLNEQNASVILKSRFIKSYFISINSENLQQKLNINRFYEFTGFFLIPLLIITISNLSLQSFDNEDYSGKFTHGTSRIFMTLTKNVIIASLKTIKSQYSFGFRIQPSTSIRNFAGYYIDRFQAIFGRFIFHQRVGSLQQNQSI